ncbi:MAG: zinc-ribbon domain-containing protein [Clostridia bacterium]|nr:zinc-ribbon domain-containing protein [Clostridia bacterium]
MAETKEKRYVSDNAQLMAEWDWEKNNELQFNPEILTLGSDKKAWWKCSKGHEWQAKINSRNNGTGCTYCSSRKILRGYNDLQTANSVLAKEWNFERNIGLTPKDVMANSNIKVWWKCGKGHEWQTTINSRNSGRGCPYCSNQKILKGYNDLQTVNPILAKEWNFEKNNALTPADVTANSNNKAWWKCRKGHEWQAVIKSRNNGRGCPICNSERSTSFPEYSIVYYLQKSGLDVVHSYREQGYELDIYIPSKKIGIEYDGYYWHKSKTKNDLEKNSKCKKDGIKLYRIREGLLSLNDTSIDYIVQKNQKDLPQILEDVLSKIIGMDVDVDLERDIVDIENLREHSEKESSILFSNPKIAKEWNYKKNDNLKPEHFMPNSSKKVWWRCSKGHEWQATIADRNSGCGCPYCAGQKIIKGYNDLQAVNPILAKEWNYEKNNGLTPTDVMPNSSKKVWWKCSNGHEWQATIGSRNKGNGCPHCSGRLVIKGKNDLQTINPILVKEWNYEKNNGLTPLDITPNSDKKVWWKCSNGHEWQARIADRNSGHGCPYCAGQKVLKGRNDLQTVNPILAKEWNYEKNDGLTPTDVMPNSSKKVWWKCSKDHEWQATIADRNSGCGCPYCVGRKVAKGYNDLQTVNPILASEWNFEKNNELTPMDITLNSGKKVWWKCSKGHEWQARIANRNIGSGCPVCAKESRKRRN